MSLAGIRMPSSATTTNASASTAGGSYLFPILAASFALIVCFALEAVAQNRPEDRNRADSSRVSLGAPNAALCAEAAAAGRLDDQAAEACDRAVETERLTRANQIATQINRGAVHLRRRDGEAALSAYDAAIALDPDNADAHLSRGVALHMIGRPGPAVAAITEALSLGLSAPYVAYYYRAAAREALGDARGAYEDYRTALAIEPNWDPAHQELGRFARVRRDALADASEADDGGGGNRSAP